MHPFFTFCKNLFKSTPVQLTEKPDTRVEEPTQTMMPVTTPRDALILQIDAQLAALQFAEACHELAQLVDQYPHDTEIIHRYFMTASYFPASNDYHRAAALCFALPEEHQQLIYEVFTQYLKHAQPSVRFSTVQLVYLCNILALGRHGTDAERLIKVLSKYHLDDKNLAKLLWKTAKAFQKNNETALYEALRSRLQQSFPDSEEANNLA